MQHSDSQPSGSSGSNTAFADLGESKDSKDSLASIADAYALLEMQGGGEVLDDSGGLRRRTPRGGAVLQESAGNLLRSSSDLSALSGDSRDPILFPPDDVGITAEEISTVIELPLIDESEQKLLPEDEQLIEFCSVNRIPIVPPKELWHCYRTTTLQAMEKAYIDLHSQYAQKLKQHAPRKHSRAALNPDLLFQTARKELLEKRVGALSCFVNDFLKLELMRRKNYFWLATVASKFLEQWLAKLLKNKSEIALTQMLQYVCPSRTLNRDRSVASLVESRQRRQSQQPPSRIESCCTPIRQVVNFFFDILLRLESSLFRPSVMRAGYGALSSSGASVLSSHGATTSHLASAYADTWGWDYTFKPRVSTWLIAWASQKLVQAAQQQAANAREKPSVELVSIAEEKRIMTTSSEPNLSGSNLELALPVAAAPRELDAAGWIADLTVKNLTPRNLILNFSCIYSVMIAGIVLTIPEIIFRLPVRIGLTLINALALIPAQIILDALLENGMHYMQFFQLQLFGTQAAEDIEAFKGALREAQATAEAMRGVALASSQADAVMAVP